MGVHLALLINTGHTSYLTKEVFNDHVLIFLATGDAKCYHLTLLYVSTSDERHCDVLIRQAILTFTLSIHAAGLGARCGGIDDNRSGYDWSGVSGMANT